MHDRTATVEDYRVLHPDQDWIPPLVTEDGDVTAVGTAHGRTIPIIGTTRPPTLLRTRGGISVDDYAERVVCASSPHTRRYFPRVA